MRILHLLNHYAPVGGVETYVLSLLPALEAQGHENVVVYRQSHPRTLTDNVRQVVHVPNTVSTTQAQQQIVQLQADVVYLHDLYDSSLMSAITEKIPTAAYVHIFYPVCPGLGKLFRRTDTICTRPFGMGCIPHIYLDRCASARNPRSVHRIMQSTAGYLRSYRQMSVVVVASRYMRHLLIQNGIEAARIQILPPHLIDSPPGEPEPPSRHRNHALFVGRLAYEKGIPYLLRAFQHIQPPHRLRIAGDGPENSRYQQLAQSLGIRDRVDFLGWQSNRERDIHYQTAAVTVMPTIMAEPFGKVGVEAMRFGCPVVAFDVGGIGDWLEDEQTGFLVPPRNVEALAKRLQQVLGNPSLRQTMGRKAQTHVQTEYETNRHVQQLLAILNMAIASR